VSDWQERITCETAPAIRVEHDLRYRAAAPLIVSSGAWADLGCGNGIAAAAALGNARPNSALLVDLDAAAVQQAVRELSLPKAEQMTADLSDPRDLERVGERLARLGRGVVVTCFEVVEHLSSFVPLLEWSAKVASEHEATFVLSVPNDAFWSIQNPHHQTTWSDGAFEELRRLLPGEHVLLRQVALAGSALLPWDGAREHRELDVAVGGDGTVVTHFIAAFGPKREQMWRGARAVQTDVLAQRSWERQRDSDVALAIAVAEENRAAVERMEKTIATQAEELRANTREFEDWREYIHGLERELGKPLAGTPEAAAAAEHRDVGEPRA
jgi:SAM-dependent methyltransferase